MAVETVRIKNTGLRGITVADTKISYIDGENGILIYRGYRIEELAERSTFMETAFLLLHGRLPKESELERFERQVVQSRDVPGFILESLEKFPKQADPMDVLQACVPMLAVADPELNDDSREANVRKAIRLIARFPAVVAAWHRIRNGEKPLPPDNALSHAANFLWQLTGKKPSKEIAQDLDVCLILHADHTFNASTFACREVVSTKAHMYAGVAAGVGALSGSLHGGANERVMKMLLKLESEVKSVDEIGAWVKNRIESGEKIMGMGHAVYKTDRSPRENTEADVAPARQKDRPRKMVRLSHPHRRRRSQGIHGPRQIRHQDQCRFLQRVGLCHDGNTDRYYDAGFRYFPNRRVVRAHNRGKIRGSPGKTCAVQTGSRICRPLLRGCGMHL